MCYNQITMNDFLLLTLLERLVSLYDSHQLTVSSETYTPKFISLVGDIKDALSNIE